MKHFIFKFETYQITQNVVLLLKLFSLITNMERYCYLCIYLLFTVEKIHRAVCKIYITLLPP